jgi:transcriptional regulator with XRE-family HTH domain
MGISRQAYNRLEADENKPSLNTIMNIAELYQLSPSLIANLTGRNITFNSELHDPIIAEKRKLLAKIEAFQAAIVTANLTVIVLKLRK